MDGKALVAGLALFASADIAPAEEPTALVKQLGDNRYAVRERAFRALSARPTQATFEVLKGPFEDPETDERAGRLREIHLKSLIPEGWDGYPWIEMLPPGTEDKEATICKYREKLGNYLTPGPCFSSDQQATRLMILDLLKEGKTYDEVGCLIHRMQETQMQSQPYAKYILAVLSESLK
jgi:hypothetical protein